MDFLLEKGIFEQLHTQCETELIFIVRGEAKAWILESCYTLSSGSMIVFNSGIMHKLCSRENTVVCRALFSDDEIAAMVQNENFLFQCNSAERFCCSYKKLADIFKALMNDAIFGKHQSECIKYSLLYQMLDCLIENFSRTADPEELSLASGDERMQFIFRYVERHFSENILLSDLAGKLFVSTSTISRFFKKQTGSYFKEYLKKVRLSHALQRLKKTDDSMTQIAMDCGFANPSVFNHIFKDAYGMTPNAYRREKKQHVSEAAQDKQARKEDLLLELSVDQSLELSEKQSLALMLNVNQSKMGIFKKICNETMNIGAIDNLTRMDIQKHTLYLKEKLGIRYVRLWNIFSKKLELTDGIHTGCYNYDMLDSIFDFLLDNDLIPFLEFGKRESVAMAFANKTVYREAEYIEFHSREAWEAMFADFLRHVTTRYGQEEVSRWRFEVAKNRLGIEECQCYADESYDYFNVYGYVWHTVKAVLPEAMVGGPMGFCRFDLRFFETFLERCKMEKCIPDFVSWALFPYEISEKGEIAQPMADVPGNFELEVACTLRKLIEERIGHPCMLFITEWNCSISSRNYLNDSCYRAVYLAKVVGALSETVDMLCVWVASDWISSYYDTVSIVNGGNGILTKNTIPKPVCMVMEFFKRMGSNWLAKGDHYIFTKTKGDEFYILFYNFSSYGSRFEGREDNVESPEKIVKDFDDRRKQTIELTVEGLASETMYMLKWRRINEREGSILGVWENFGYESQLSAEDIDYIRESCRPKLAIERYISADGRMCLTIDIKEREIVLLHGFRAG